jgi:hypothetical protein
LQNADDVLSAFLDFERDSVAGRSYADRKASTFEQAREYLFPKYPTTHNLLKLQLKCAYSDFRRFVLVHFLILFQSLQSSVKIRG